MRSHPKEKKLIACNVLFVWKKNRKGPCVSLIDSALIFQISHKINIFTQLFIEPFKF